MKRFLMNFFFGFLCTATAFAANSNISRIIPTKNNGENISEEATSLNTSAASNRATVSRNVVRKTQNTNTTNKNSNVTARSVNTRKSNSSATLSDAVNTVGRSARTEAASVNNLPSLRRAGITLRASTAEVGGRATIGDSDIQTGSNIDEQIRGIQSRASIFGSNKKTVTTESLIAAKEIMEKTADLNNTCQQQYNECMDQFCAVVDTNQKRCSCSSNLARYTKAQEAVEDANAELNEIAQQIRYVGLSADEIHAIMSATEAELEINKTKDKTKTRSILDDIADMIKDPTADTTLYSSTNMDSLLDIDLDFSSDASDIFGLDLLGTTNDISLKRGGALYNEAKKRCKSVISRCKEAGGTEGQISGNYDLEIAKDCASYEQGLEKLNQTLKNNVRSANLMLQKARLAVLQNKNEYDVRECIGALETCMLDEMVCGDDYVKCLDPTKVYIDENGEVVLGRNLANITLMMSAYDNTKITENFIKNAVSSGNCATDGSCIVKYLMTKVGTGQSFKDGGLCRPVLDKCQYYTYEKTGKNSTYNPYNEVVVNYIQRALVNIKASQAKIISKYASSCMTDVGDCYNQQNTQITSLYTVTNVDNIYRVMKGTCYNVALTCGYAVFAYDAAMGDKMYEIRNTITQSEDVAQADKETKIDQQQKDALIYGISEMFYQSLLCPDNSSFSDVKKEDAEDQSSYVNERCVCNEGYAVYGSSCVCNYMYNGRCVVSCPNGEDNTPNAPYISNGECVASCPSGQSPNDNNECTE